MIWRNGMLRTCCLPAIPFSFHARKSTDTILLVQTHSSRAHTVIFGTIATFRQCSVVCASVWASMLTAGDCFLKSSLLAGDCCSAIKRWCYRSEELYDNFWKNRACVMPLHIPNRPRQRRIFFSAELIPVEFNCPRPSCLHACPVWSACARALRRGGLCPQKGQRTVQYT